MFRIDKASVDLSSDPARINLLEVKPTPVELANARPEPEPEPMENPAEIIERANQEAVMIVQRAYKEVERMKKDARIEGFNNGKNEFEATVAGMAEEQAAAFQAMVARFESEHEAMAQQANIAAVKLAMNIAEKILRFELDRNDEAFLSIAQEAVDRLNGSGKITLRVSPEEYRRFFAEGGIAGIVTDRKLTVIEDGRLGEGGCVAESDEETVDAGVENQLGKVNEAFGLAKGNDHRPY